MLNRINNNSFARESRDLIQNGARAKLKIIMGRLDGLLKLRNGKKLVVAATNFNNQKEDLTPNQLSFIENIYEKSWKAKGYEGATTKHDFKRKLWEL